MAKLKLERLYKVYDGRVKAVNDLSLEINHQDFIVFVDLQDVEKVRLYG